MAQPFRLRTPRFGGLAVASAEAVRAVQTALKRCSTPSTQVEGEADQFVGKVKRRTADQARWNIDAADEPAPYATRAGRSGLVVPDGTRSMALLDNALSTTNAREGDPFTMTTRSPSDYEGAVIHGFVSTVNESGRPAGPGLTLNLRNLRVTFASRLLLSDRQICDLFRAAMVERRGGTVDDDWIRVFKRKRDEISKARCGA